MTALLSVAGVATATWTAHPFSDPDRTAVLEMFTEADFLFRTTLPDTLAESDVLALLDGAQVLLADGEPVGLYALEHVGGAHACHYQLHLRLRSSAPDAWWATAYHEIVRCARWRGEVVRLSLIIDEFDRRYLRIAESLGLTEEGTLGRVSVHRGARFGKVHLGQIWAPQR
jgi:RimJ/RimL family protein N-acetyltransferase